VDVSATLILRSWKGILLSGFRSPFYVMQTLSGPGLAFIAGSGSVVEKVLLPGQVCAPPCAKAPVSVS
jgi:uncharacterized protein (AIM24 family)